MKQTKLFWMLAAILVISGTMGLTSCKEDAKNWDYTMDADMQNRLYKIMWSYINSGRLTDEQTQAVLKPES